MQIFFFKWRIEIFSDCNQPPYPRTLTAYPTPVLGGTPDLFHHNDRKGCKRDYLDARGHFVLRFSAIGDKPLDGGNHPPDGNHPVRKTRVYKLQILIFIKCHYHNRKKQASKQNIGLKVLKGVLHPWPVFWLFMHFSKKLQHIGNK